MSESLSPRRLRTRRRLAQAAIELYAEAGIAASTVETICERAGFSRGAFYANFPTKEALSAEILAALHEALSDWTERALARVRDDLTTTPNLTTQPGPDLLDRTTRRVLNLDAIDPSSPDPWSHASLTLIELSLQAVRDPSVREAYRAGRGALLDPLGSFLEQLAQLLGRRLSVSPEMAAGALIAVFLAASRSALAAGDRVADTLAPRLAVLLGRVTAPLA